MASHRSLWPVYSKLTDEKKKKNHLPEVCNFHCLMVAEKVLWFEITMQVVVLVHVGQSLQGLKHYVANHLLWEELSSFSHQLVHVEVKVFKDEVEGVSVQVDLIKAHNVWMAQLQERLDLLLGDALVPSMILLLHLLDSHDFS